MHPTKFQPIQIAYVIFEQPITITLTCQGLFKKCWKFEPENRHTFEEIITVLQVETTKSSQTEIVFMPKTKKNTETNFKYTSFDTLISKSNETKITVTKEIQELHPLNGEKNNQIEKENLQKSRMISVRKCLKLLLIIIIFLVASGIVITLLVSNLYGNDRINATEISTENQRNFLGVNKFWSTLVKI